MNIRIFFFIISIGCMRSMHAQKPPSKHIQTVAHKRILIISDTIDLIGGAEEVIKQIIPRLKKKNALVHHMNLEEVTTFNVPFANNISQANPFFAKKFVKQTIEQFKPDFIIIVFLGILSYAAGNYCFKSNIPFTIFYPSRIPEIAKLNFGIPSTLSYYFVDKLLNRASNILVPTPSIKQSLEGRGIKNVHAWLHGIDPKKFKIPTLQEKIIATYACNLSEKKRPFYLYVGRLSNSKNINAFLNLNVPGTKILVGPEDSGYKIKSLQKKYPHIIFAGPQRGQELINYYRTGDVFVFPSKTDTFGLVLLEALASGLPIVAFNVSGPKDIAPHQTGISYLARNNKDLQLKALQAWYDIKAGKHSVKKCRTRATVFSWDNAVITLINHLKPIHHDS